MQSQQSQKSKSLNPKLSTHIRLPELEKTCTFTDQQVQQQQICYQRSQPAPQFKLPQLVIPKGMLNMNSISMQNRVCEIQTNLRKQDIPSILGCQFIQNCSMKNLVISHLDLTIFKTEPCNESSKHNYCKCPYYHSDQDRRRIGIEYSSDLCRAIQQGLICPKQDKCLDAHNEFEQYYHQTKYKTKFCKFYPKDIAICCSGEYCPFAHSESEIKAELLENFIKDADFYMFYFKTSCCPWVFTCDHNEKICPYAHSMDEVRRKINKQYYEPQYCQHWFRNTQAKSFQQRCPEVFACKYVHGNYELDYHPLIYKTRLCTNPYNCANPHCPNYHNEIDQRILNEDLIYRVFKIIPRNRIVENIFKTKAPEIRTEPKSVGCPIKDTINKIKRSFMK